MRSPGFSPGGRPKNKTSASGNCALTDSAVTCCRRHAPFKKGKQLAHRCPPSDAWRAWLDQCPHAGLSVENGVQG